MRPRWGGHSRPRSWFPRARGDAPFEYSPRVMLVMVPPRTRGCALDGAVRGESLTGSPAHAGMRPRPGSSTPAPRWFPRARGDAPEPCRVEIAPVVVPPRTRGCAHRLRRYRARDDGSPAHAGMRPGLAVISSAGLRFPRARGDAPGHQEGLGDRSGVPPRTRGCALYKRDHAEKLLGSPAHAGMRPPPSPRAPRRTRFPRARGDAPRGRRSRFAIRSVPPRTRGCAQRGLLGAGAKPGSPAHAGMRPAKADTLSRSGRFPRARGDAPRLRCQAISFTPVPPRTRGCARYRREPGRHTDGSPAHAGMRPRRASG